MKRLFFIAALMVSTSSISFAATTTTTKTTTTTTSGSLSTQVEPAPAIEQFEKADLRVSPLSLLIGGVDAHVGFHLSDTVALGPQLSYYNNGLSDYHLSAYALAARANIKFNGKTNTDGWYWGPFLGYANATVSAFHNLSATASGVVAGCMFGYQWVWNNGFNMNLGGGFSAAAINKIHVDDGQGDTLDVSGPGYGSSVGLEWSIGLMI